MKDTLFSSNELMTFHQMDDYMDAIRGTIVLQLPSKEVLLKCITNIDLQFLAKVGVTRCHQDDVYKKKVGRAIAMKNIDYKSFSINKIKVIDNETVAGIDINTPIIGIIMEATTTVKFYNPNKSNPIVTELFVRFILENNRSDIRLVRAWWNGVSR